MSATSVRWLAVVLIAAGASMMLVKGVVRALTTADLSLVPWFGLGAALGLTLVARSLTREGSSTRATTFAAWLGGGAAVAAIVAVGYLLTGTIPESDGAPALVGLSYAVMATGTFLALFVLGVVIAQRRLLENRWRWVPIAVIAVQFPVFMLSEAVGDALGRSTVTDGLGMALTGVAWALLAYALTRQPRTTAERSR